MPPGRTRTFGALTGAFWIKWLLATVAGEMAGQALHHISPHRSGRVIVALMLSLVALLIWRGTARRFLHVTFWAAAFLLSVLGAVSAEAIDVSMGIGDIGAIAPIVIWLMFAGVICYRCTGDLPAPANGANIGGFFWVTAALAQAIGSACADWIIAPGGPPARLAVAAIALVISATIARHVYTRLPRPALFWIALLLLGTGAALGGHAVANSIAG